VVKYTALEQSNEGSSMLARKSHSIKYTARPPAVVERADFGWPRAIIARSDGCSEAVMDVVETVASGKLYVFSRMYRLIWVISKLALRQSRYVWWILTSHSPDVNFLDYYVWNVNWKGHKQISVSQCDVIKDRCNNIHRHGQRYITACMTLQTENRDIFQANGGYVE